MGPPGPLALPRFAEKGRGRGLTASPQGAHTPTMLVEQDWRVQAKCRSLSPREADDIFFPENKGSKPGKARRFCSDCPVVSRCLTDAIAYKADGFVAGETVTSRAEMKVFVDTTVVALETWLPPEAKIKKRRIYRKVFTSPDTHDWLDEVIETPFD